MVLSVVIVASSVLSIAAEDLAAAAELMQWQQLCGSERTEAPLLPVLSVSVPEGGVPDEFDARKQWPQCPSIGRIRDQSKCGSCWAISATEAFNDRYCISTGDGKIEFSAADTMACASGSGCGGGQPANAWSFFASQGVVSGGLYGESSGNTCMPYPFAQCAHHTDGGTYPACPKKEYETPACSATCTDTAYAKSYSADKVRMGRAYAVQGESSIQAEIMAKGPTTAILDVMGTYPLTEWSMPKYKYGIYVHGSGDMKLGGHAVKIIGWGLGHTSCYALSAAVGDVWCMRSCASGNCPATICKCDENPPDQGTTPYWLIANSWNAEWGDKGTFKILRGQNECGIETNIYGGDFESDELLV